MLMHILLAIIAAILQIAVIWALKVDFFKSFFIATPFILLHQYIFIYNYLKAPNFLVIWFVTTGIAATLSFLAGSILFKDGLTPTQIAGVVCILIGIILMRF